VLRTSGSRSIKKKREKCCPAFSPPLCPYPASTLLDSDPRDKAPQRGAAGTPARVASAKQLVPAARVARTGAQACHVGLFQLRRWQRKVRALLPDPPPSFFVVDIYAGCSEDVDPCAGAGLVGNFRPWAGTGRGWGDSIPIGNGDVHFLIYTSILIDLFIFFAENSGGVASHQFRLLGYHSFDIIATQDARNCSGWGRYRGSAKRGDLVSK
jgi:hypothetical protein